MKKTLISFLLTVLLGMMSVDAFAHDIEVANSDGVTIYYTYQNNKTELAVSYRGDNYKDYSNKYKDNLVIPEFVTYNGSTYPVTSIGRYAFLGCSGLTSVAIPNSVTSIGSGAFHSCTGLTCVNIPNSVTSIGSAVFAHCSGLTSVTIPNSMTSIGGSAFAYCTGLTSVTIPNSIISIGINVFSGCSGLTSVTIPNSVTTIGESSFSGCSNMTSMTIPSSVTSIGKDAFVGCDGLTTIIVPITNYFTFCDNNVLRLLPYGVPVVLIDEKGNDIKSYIIPEGVTVVENYTFYNSGLTSVIIPNSVTYIGERAFLKCSSLTSVTIGNSVTSIGNQAFYDCPSLMEVKSYIDSPFNLSDNMFSNETWRQGTLYVPEGTKDLYSRFDGWRNFLNIVEMADEGSVAYLSLKDAAAGQMKLQVKKGENYTFAIEAEAGWKVSSVTYNGVDVTKQLDEQGRFTTPAITADATLNVVYEQLNTQVAHANTEEAKLNVEESGFRISKAREGTICQVFSTEGKLLKNITLHGESTFIRLTKGQIYIVKVGDKTFKAAL